MMQFFKNHRIQNFDSGQDQVKDKSKEFGRNKFFIYSKVFSQQSFDTRTFFNRTKHWFQQNRTCQRFSGKRSTRTCLIAQWKRSIYHTIRNVQLRVVKIEVHVQQCLFLPRYFHWQMNFFPNLCNKLFKLLNSKV